MNPRLTNQPLLTVDCDPRQPATVWVGVYKLDANIMALLGKCAQADCLLRSIFRVTVVEPGSPIGDSPPGVLGRYRIVENGIRFVPHFPFDCGLLYRASFDPRPLGCLELSDVPTLEFSFPSRPMASSTKVKHIFPSSDCLPENLLRFYVCFSNAMQRGHAAAEISVLGPNGERTPDVLYRAPVELWDSRMRCLTIMLDPGRLKRGLSPNRELGPPLRRGQVYTLAVGAGMIDIAGRRLGETVHKRFRVADAVREPIAVEHWNVLPPRANSRLPVVLMFPRPLDWALLSQTITIASTCGQSIAGRVSIDQCERRWSFTPASPWAAGTYHVRVTPDLGDVCGNDAFAAFDRPFRSGSDLRSEPASRSIPVQLL